MSYTKAVLIVAGGQGKRMGMDIPKQFLEINSLPIIFHTINAFKDYDINMPVIVILPEEHIDYLHNLIKKHGLNYGSNVVVVKGGNERFDSVKNGLDYIKQNVNNDGLTIGIHDGVRPFVDKAFIGLCYDTAKKYGSCIPVIPLKDSLRYISVEENRAIDRSKYFRVQTPQCFDFAGIYSAYLKSSNNLFTDDASVYESNGNDINFVEGLETNIKITSRLDLIIAECILAEYYKKKI